MDTNNDGAIDWEEYQSAEDARKFMEDTKGESVMTIS